MRRGDLAKRLIDAANNRERSLLFSQHKNIADIRLANEIRSACYAAWTTEPAKARGAESSISALAKLVPSDEIGAIRLWVTGIAEITKGRFERAAEALDAAARMFAKLGQITDSAQARVAELMALAMLGRYEAAVATGQEALKIFESVGDELAAGKIEMNLSNVAARRDLHADAEKYALSARQRFKKIGEHTWQTMAENDLANTYAEINNFDEARRFYRLALEGADAEKMYVTEAEIEANLGNLVRLQGNYAEALRYLESSRRRYDQLEMPHQSAIADLEIADIYSELNLSREALVIYERVSLTFNRLRMYAEEARSRLNYGRTAAAVGDLRTANRELARSLRLFLKEKNRTGETSVLLTQAKVALDNADVDGVVHSLAAAAGSIKRSQNPRHQTDHLLLKGLVSVKQGKSSRAEKELTTALELANRYHHQSAAQYALNALGEIAVRQGDMARAGSLFASAIRVIEDLRSPLDSEFSLAYFASKLGPYENLTRLLLAQNDIANAFTVMESGRSRALLDSLQTSNGSKMRDEKLTSDLSELRSDLNLLYKRLDISSEDEAAKLRLTIAAVESKLVATERQIKSLHTKSNEPAGSAHTLSLPRLMESLGQTRSLVEFAEVDGTFSAYVVVRGQVRYFPALCTSSSVRAGLNELHFHFQTMRYGTGFAARFAAELKGRADAALRRLYDLLLRPVAEMIGTDAVVIVPAGVLHYVPFHALFDGESYLIESREVQYAPSAAIWDTLARRPRRKFKSSLLMAYADELIPLVENEVMEISAVLPRPRLLTGAEATFAGFVSEAGGYDLIHMACHGNFRAENPMFSSLHLADGWVTVRDVTSRHLRAKLVTLSACETGVNELFAGDEILGLARGFLSAGAESLIVSLWSVNDEATGRLMRRFYENLQRGMSAAASLRLAQVGFIERGEHPYLWSPFITIGR